MDSDGEERSARDYNILLPCFWCSESWCFCRYSDKVRYSKFYQERSRHNPFSGPWLFCILLIHRVVQVKASNIVFPQSGKVLCDWSLYAGITICCTLPAIVGSPDSTLQEKKIGRAHV